MPSVHQIKAIVHEKTILWKEVKLQTYFTGYGRIDYFIVIDSNKREGFLASGNNSTLLTQLEKELFK